MKIRQREYAMATRSSTKAKKLTNEAFVVTGEGENAFWTKLGAAGRMTMAGGSTSN